MILLYFLLHIRPILNAYFFKMFVLIYSYFTFLFPVALQSTLRAPVSESNSCLTYLANNVDSDSERPNTNMYTSALLHT